jgi:pantoate--beta-alanine ligase
MRLVGTRAEVRAWVGAARRAGETVALVPTMGYLHDGHLSLLELAHAQADRVALSIFVNPLQFGPGEDLDRYPRDLDRDLELARGAGAELVFAPTAAEMYPGGEPWVAVVPERGADRLCGAARPGHFRGVLTVVAKLFGIFAPNVAVFGRKDYQQLTLIRRMVEDLDIPVRIEAGAIVRDPDGLALSSRNAYLDPEERRRALALSRGLAACVSLFEKGIEDPAVYRRAMVEALAGNADLEYAEIVDGRTLDPLERVLNGAVCAVAARVGATRLIDNTVLGSAT